MPSSSTHHGVPFVAVAVDGANNVYATEGENGSYGGILIHPGSSQITGLFSTAFSEAYATGLCQDLAGNLVVPGGLRQPMARSLFTRAPAAIP